MQSEKLVFTAKFKVRAHDVNTDQYCTIPALIKNMQECSFEHARRLKASVWDMGDASISWVILHEELKVLRPLRLDEKYSIVTYPSGFDKFFAYRDYLIFDEDRKLIAGASSTWVLINTETRKLSKIPAEIMNMGSPSDVKFLTRSPKKIDIVGERRFLLSTTIYPYDLDWNNHVNNMVLIRIMLNALKLEGIEDQFMKNISLVFKNESVLGDHLTAQLITKENVTVVRLDMGSKVIARLKLVT